ncbi:MAG: hypothetical protein LBC74_07415 [Planctomycetaceae bacterium]|nr:hypothetical protein [Planctomycetaceae bacterium]
MTKVITEMQVGNCNVNFDGAVFEVKDSANLANVKMGNGGGGGQTF